MKGLQLLATGGALPGRVVTNEDLSRQVDTSDEWITTRTGIRQRYYCTESEDAATLAIAAARQALARSGLAASEIACCVAATLSAPTATPSVACRVQAALGLPENRPAFDVNAACSGFIYAIAAAHGLLNTLGGRYALVIGCEALSRMVDPTDRTTCVLFGDGAGAAILELAEGVPFAVTLGARGSEAIRVGGPAACDTAPITMDGKAVFRFAVETMPRCLQTVLERSQKTLADLDWVVCHQANSRIIDHCIKHLHAEPSKFYKNMDRHGNTSAASIPIALHEMVDIFNKEGIETEVIHVGNKDIRGCVACGQCSKLGHCVFNDLVNEVATKFAEADGLVVGSPVYYASANATLVALLTRLFYSTPFDKTMKVGAAVVAARRGGLSATFDELNKFFTISGMPVASSQYWNSIHGLALGEAKEDLEGLQTMRTLARNMTFLMKSIALGKEKFGLPETEQRIATNFIR